MIPSIAQISRIDLPVLAQQLEIVLQVVFSRHLCEFSNEALSRKTVRDIGDRAKPADSCVGWDLRILDTEIRHCNWDIVVPHIGLEFLLMLGIGTENGANGRSNRAVQPASNPTSSVQTGLQMFARHGMEIVITYVILPSPLNSRRLTRKGFRDFHRLVDEVRLGLPSKATAKERHVDPCLLQGKARPLGRSGPCRLRGLGRSPDFEKVVFQASCGHRGLHRGMGNVREIIGGGVGLVGLVERLV